MSYARYLNKLARQEKEGLVTKEEFNEQKDMMLERLEELKSFGAVSQEEYNKEKKEILITDSQVNGKNHSKEIKPLDKKESIRKGLKDCFSEAYLQNLAILFSLILCLTILKSCCFDDYKKQPKQMPQTVKKSATTKAALCLKTAEKEYD